MASRHTKSKATVQPARPKGLYLARVRWDNTEQIKKELDKNGLVVITDVITPAQCDDLIQQYREWLSKFGENNFPDNIRTLIHKYGVAHLKPSWEARLLAKKVFAGVWGTEKLLSSYDGVAIGKPPETGFGVFNERIRHSLHLDQGPDKVGLHAYQGALYLEEADEDDWCFQVLTQSHKHHADFFQTHAAGRSEFRRLKDDDVTWMLGKGCDFVRVPVPKGGMVLWDSRLVHDGAPPSEHRTNKDRWRFVNFISMTPAIWASYAEKAKHKEGMTSIQCSRHWSSSHFELFAKSAAGSGGPHVSELPEVATTNEAMQISGEMDYDFSDGESNGPDKPVTKGTPSMLIDNEN